MTIHFYLERKKLKSNDITIWCYVRGLAPGKTIQLNTRQKIEKQFWDYEKERAIDRGKNKYFGYKELNSLLDSYEEEIKKAYRVYLTDNHNADYESIKLAIQEALGNKQGVSHSFFEALDLFMETRTRDLSPSSIKKFRTLKKHLSEYEKKARTEVTFRKVDLLFYDKLLKYLIEEKGMINNSAYKLIGHLKTFLKWSYDRGLNKCNYFEQFKVKEDKVDIITLTGEELKKLSDMDFSDNKRLERTRDLFLFGCNTGVRFIDLVNISREDIKNNNWYLRVQKTRDVIEIPLTEKALSILDKYKDEEYPLPKLSNQKFNMYLKEVGKKAEISDIVKTVSYSGSKPIEKEQPKYEYISSHTARRTFITESLWKGMKQHTVMAITGHTTYKSFQKYVNITMKDKAIEMNKAWNGKEAESENTKTVTGG